MTNTSIHILSADALSLLERLIALPSLSKEEHATADLIVNFLEERDVHTRRLGNNIFCRNIFFDPQKPTILLCAHHDTVAPNSGYTRDPFYAHRENGRLYGLGSTDAGASLVGLLAAFIHFYERDELLYNIIFTAAAEEEISGSNGITALMADGSVKEMFRHKDSFAIIGEPTGLDLATAEKGLIVFDGLVKGRAGHAAREEGDNAINKAMAAIGQLNDLQFDKISELLGAVKVTVTSVFTENKAHNIIPASCNFTVDVRTTEQYTPEEIVGILQKNVEAELTPRSTRLRATAIPSDHPVVLAGIALGKKVYGSPTLSDKALVGLNALKCGPGNSAQSHSADEYAEISQIEEGVRFYIALLEKVCAGRTI